MQLSIERDLKKITCKHIQKIKSNTDKVFAVLLKCCTRLVSLLSSYSSTRVITIPLKMGQWVIYHSEQQANIKQAQ